MAQASSSRYGPRVIRLRFVEEYRDRRIVTNGELYGVESELVTDCRYLNAAGARAAIDSEAGIAAHRKDIDWQRRQAAEYITREGRENTFGCECGWRGSYDQLKKATTYPFSGLLRCAECGAPMSICGGSSTKYYSCSDANKRGTCTNRLSLREDIARTCMLRLMRELLTTPKEVAFIRKATAELLGEMSRKVNADVGERRQRLQRTEQRIAGLVTFIAEGDHSEYVRTTLKDLEAQATTEKRAIAELLERG